MVLELSSLQKAVISLERAVKVATSNEKMDKLDENQKDTIRAGVIQNFEFTYELCWKFMKRWLEANVNRESVDGVTRKELFRIAAENCLIKDVPAWFNYHKARNQTTHIYDNKIAEDVFAVAVLFVIDAKALLKVLEAKND